MGAIVGGIILLVLGAISYFALEFDLPGIDASMLGIILMVAGGVLFVVGLVLAARSRRTVVATRQQGDATISERRDPPAAV